jgi:hypothetical protein
MDKVNISNSFGSKHAESADNHKYKPLNTEGSQSDIAE